MLDPQDEVSEEVVAPTTTRLHPPFPFGSRWKQQALPTVYTPMSDRIILACLAFTAVTFGALSYYLYQDMDKVVNVDLRYDHIHNYQIIPGSSKSVNHGTHQFFAQNTYPGLTSENVTSVQGTRTILNFTIPETLKPPVYLQYRLVDVFQSFRRYWESISNYQQLGIAVTSVDLFKCRPFRSPGENVQKNTHNDQQIVINGETKHFSDLFYNPCGLVSWSKFNDSFTLRRLPPAGINESLQNSGSSWPFQLKTKYVSTRKTSTAPSNGGGALLCNGSDFDKHSNRKSLNEIQNPCQKAGIAWDDDLKRRFVDIKPNPLEWTGVFSGTTDNIFLQNGWYFNEAGHEVPYPRDEDHLTWLRNGPLPDFSMMYRTLETTELPTSEFYNGETQPVVYQVEVSEFFDVASFGGEKHFVLWAKGKEGSSFDRQGKANWLLFYLYACTSGIAAVLFVAITSSLYLGWLSKKSIPVAVFSRFDGLTPQVLAQLALSEDAGESFFNMEPSLTLAEALEPNSYEVRNYIKTAAARRFRRAHHSQRVAEYEAELQRRHADLTKTE